MAAKKKAAAAKAPAKKRMSRAPVKRMPKKQKADTAGLEPLSCALEAGDPSVAPLEKIIEAEGGLVVGRYKDPLGGHPLVTAILPVGKIEPTPFQRDLSDTHHKRLSDVIQKMGRFLDPLIAITSPKHAPSKKKPAASEGSDVAFWTPNGRHRLEAMRRLGAKAVTALVVPTREIAWQILALNTEKAHNLKERALEVVRIYRGLLEEDDTLAEKGFSFYLEDPALVTIGVCYEKNGRFAGGAYHPILRRLEEFSDEPIKSAIVEHEKLAGLVLELEVAVSAAIQKLKEKGFVSPYLRAFVVSRINPLRWIQGDLPSAEKVLTQMRDRALKFKTDNIKQDDLAKMGGGVPDEDA